MVQPYCVVVITTPTFAYSLVQVHHKCGMAMVARPYLHALCIGCYGLVELGGQWKMLAMLVSRRVVLYYPSQCHSTMTLYFWTTPTSWSECYQLAWSFWTSLMTWNSMRSELWVSWSPWLPLSVLSQSTSQSMKPQSLSKMMMPWVGCDHFVFNAGYVSEECCNHDQLLQLLSYTLWGIYVYLWPYYGRPNGRPYGRFGDRVVCIHIPSPTQSNSLTSPLIN